jgi:transposase
MCNEAGIRLEYLPSYSLDFNPIEKAFAELKTWIKKNYALMKVYDTFDQFLEHAL